MEAGDALHPLRQPSLGGAPALGVLHVHVVVGLGVVK